MVILLPVCLVVIQTWSVLALHHLLHIWHRCSNLVDLSYQVLPNHFHSSDDETCGLGEGQTALLWERWRVVYCSDCRDFSEISQIWRWLEGITILSIYMSGSWHLRNSCLICSSTQKRFSWSHRLLPHDRSLNKYHIKEHQPNLHQIIPTQHAVTHSSIHPSITIVRNWPSLWAYENKKRETTVHTCTPGIFEDLPIITCSRAHVVCFFFPRLFAWRYQQLHSCSQSSWSTHEHTHTHTRPSHGPDGSLKIMLWDHCYDFAIDSCFLKFSFALWRFLSFFVVLRPIENQDQKNCSSSYFGCALVWNVGFCALCHWVYDCYCGITSLTSTRTPSTT